MDHKHLSLHAPSSVCTRALVLAILESRRAYQLAMSLAKRLLAEDGYLPDMPDEQTSGHLVPRKPHANMPPSRSPRLFTTEDLLARREPARSSAFETSPYKRRQRRKQRLPYGPRLVGAPVRDAQVAYDAPMTISRLSTHTPS